MNNNNFIKIKHVDIGNNERVSYVNLDKVREMEILDVKDSNCFDLKIGYRILTYETKGSTYDDRKYRICDMNSLDYIRYLLDGKK